ncbi:MAG TPA: BTAD domain-containing putative transcriptional regulator [Pyrinomonadaceae bacterium]|nr:BTAD domain-containing putative transcriptional regulator [Pyrinomonadaceae bacterium]
MPNRQQGSIHDTQPPAHVPQLPTFFLRTKLLPPRPAPSLLPRPRLTERLQQNLAHAVTLVTAPAGSGKTTFVADFIRTGGHPFVWYQLDHADSDPLVFLGYVAHGIKQIVPGFGDATTAYLQEASKELAQAPERAVDVLLNEVLDRVEQQFILVLDDYHHLGVETPVHRVVDRLLAYLPDLMHVVIISRDMPPLALARMRTQASLSVIDRQELLFTDEETRELFRNVFDLELTPEQLAEYRERTHGWITALQLVRQVAQRQALARGGAAESAPPDLVEILRQSERDIFDYFAEEVFADEDEDVQRFLLRVSLLERVEPETCGRLYPESAATLRSLARRNVFISLASDGRGEEYRLHPLFRGFLRRRFRVEAGRAAVSAEHARLADYFLGRGQWEQAMHHLLAAEDFGRAAETIAERGGAWITAGALSSLASFADAIPTQSLEAHPRALAHRAEVSRLRDEYDSAQSLFNRAAALLHEQQDAEGEAEAFHSLATIARRRGDCETAFSYLDRAMELSDERSVVRTKCGNTRGLCFVALGQWTDAEREFRVALQSAEERGDRYYARLISHNLGTPAGIRGDFGEALRWMRRMLREETGAGAPPVPQEAIAHLNIARCQMHMGDYASCERDLDRALEICQLFNLSALRGEIFEFYGNLYREQGEVARAVEYYDRAARAYDEAGIELTRTELLEERGVLALQLGDLNEARALLDRLLEARSKQDEMGRQRTTVARARVLIAQGRTDDARRDLYPALEYFRSHGIYCYEAPVAMLLAVCEHAANDEPATLNHLRRAVDLTARYDYEHWLRNWVAANPQVFSTPEAAELLPADLREQLPSTAQLEAAVAAAAQQQRAPSIVVSQGPAADLSVNMLGAVEVFRDPLRPFSPDAWVTRRARDILCFIASRRHRRASKDAIIDTFWGEADFGSVEKNFHPTISHIRKALNSNQPLKQNFLLYRDGDYQLNPEFSYRIDTEEFDRLVTEGDAARRAREQDTFVKSYEAAAELYRGEFMQGSYDEWAEEQRSYYREQYLRLLEILAQTAQKAEDWSRSMGLAQRILREDPFREDVHCHLMRAHAAQGNRVAVREQFETLRKLLRKELGVEPAAETQRVYKELLK